MKVFIDERHDTMTETLGLSEEFAKEAGIRLSEILEELKDEGDGNLSKDFDFLELISRYQKKHEFNNVQEVVFITYSYTMAFNTLRKLDALSSIL